MKKAYLFFGTAFMLALANFLTGCDGCRNNSPEGTSQVINPGPSGPVTTTITYGSSSGCTGKGICNGVQNGLQVTFSATAGNSVTMVFSVPDDTDNNASQKAYWRGPVAPDYTFDFPVDISSNAAFFAGKIWNVPAGFIVRANAQPTLQSMNSNSVTITYQAVQTRVAGGNIIFGGKKADGTYSNSIAGIVKFSDAAIPAIGDTNASIPIRFCLKPGHADTVLAFFNNDSLKNIQSGQAANFTPSTTSYIFTNAFLFSNFQNTFNNVFLPAKAFIAPGLSAYVSFSAAPNQFDTLHIPYCNFVAAFGYNLTTVTSTNITANWVNPYPFNYDSLMIFMVNAGMSPSDTIQLSADGYIQNCANGTITYQNNGLQPSSSTISYFYRLSTFALTGAATDTVITDCMPFIVPDGGPIRANKSIEKKHKK